MSVKELDRQKPVPSTYDPRRNSSPSLAETSLNRRERWLVSAGAIFGVLLLSFLPLGSGEGPSVQGRLFDAGHFWLYGAVSAVLLFCYPISAHRPRTRAVVVLLFATLLAGATEFLQPFFGRSFSVIDFIFGVLGAGAALGFFFLRNRPLRVTHYFLTLCCVIVTLYPAWHLWSVFEEQRRAFPVLAPLASADELVLWEPLSEGTIFRFLDTTAGRGLDVITERNAYSGAVLRRLPRQSWQPYAALRLTVQVPKKPMELRIRIDDRGPNEQFEDRFNDAFLLGQGRQVITIPLDRIAAGPQARVLDLSGVRKIFLFVAPTADRYRFTIERVELLPHPAR